MSTRTSLPVRAMLAQVPSVQRQIMVRLLPLLFLIFVGVLYWLGEDLKESLYSAATGNAKRAGLMAVSAVEASMMTEKGHGPWGRVAHRIAKDRDIQIDIITNRGEVLFSTEPARRGTAYRRTDPWCAVCHRPGSAKATMDTAFVEESVDAPSQVFAGPLANTDACRHCHAKDGAKLGMVFVRQSLQPIHAVVRRTQLGIALAGGVALLLAMATTRLLLGRYLSRPLKRLVTGARAIGKGDLGHRIALRERTELSVLADTLNRSTARLAELQKELLHQERLAAIGETVAGLAHCLKNLLNGLRGGQYVIESGIASRDTEKLKAGWDLTKQGIRQVEKLVFDMLYYVKDRTPKREPTDANRVIREVIDLLKDQAAEQGVELREDLDEALGSPALDGTAIYRAILNLATNAIDACLESETGDLVMLSSWRAPHEIVISVQDNGVGMSQEVLSSLFTRFFSTKDGRGTGLGLPVVKKIAEEHGGVLEVDSEPGKGTTFRLRLPTEGR